MREYKDIEKVVVNQQVVGDLPKSPVIARTVTKEVCLGAVPDDVVPCSSADESPYFSWVCKEWSRLPRGHSFLYKKL